jgi:predicted DNA-binding transcriptional regulator AlpA
MFPKTNLKPDFERHAAEYIDVAAAAEILGVSASFLNKLRCSGGGPRFARIGRSVRYNLAALREWAEARSRGSTSEAA